MFNLVKRIQDGDISVGEMMVIYKKTTDPTIINAIQVQLHSYCPNMSFSDKDGIALFNEDTGMDVLWVLDEDKVMLKVTHNPWRIKSYHRFFVKDLITHINTKMIGWTVKGKCPIHEINISCEKICKNEERPVEEQFQLDCDWPIANVLEVANKAECGCIEALDALNQHDGDVDEAAIHLLLSNNEEQTLEEKLHALRVETRDKLLAMASDSDDDDTV